MSDYGNEPNAPPSSWIGWAVAGSLLIVLTLVLVRSNRPAKPAPPAQEAPAVAAPDLSSADLSGGTPVPLQPHRDEPPPALSVEQLVARCNGAVVQVETDKGTGSAFFIAPDTLVTSLHVVAGSSYVKLRRMGGETALAYVGETARDFDLATLKVSGPRADQVFLPMGAAADLQAGQEVIALGSPLGLQNSVCRGVVSALRRRGEVLVVQSDAPINPGNSGGPLLDRSGAVVGINAFVARSPVAGPGLSFSIAVEHARALVEGKSPAAAVALENKPDIAALPGGEPPSGSEQARAQGARIYEARLALIAQHANAMDDEWERFRASGYQGRLDEASTHGWYALLDGQVQEAQVHHGFERPYLALRNKAEAVRQAMQKTEEDARQADVLPGVRRELQQKYRLAFSAWNP